MAKPNTEPITQSIDSLRTESSPDAVTPARVANLLQAIVDLINALTMVPDTEVANIMQLINNAVSTANAASSAASAAQNAANDKLISQFKADAAADGVTMTVKQTGHTAIAFSFPIANSSHAGIVLPSVLQAITDAANAASGARVYQLLLTYTSTGVRYGVRLENGTTLEKDIALATASRNGIMSKDDKQKLDNLPDSGVVALDAAGRVPAAQAPQVMLRNVVNTVLDDLRPGDFYFDSGHIFYVPSATDDPIDMGVPSRAVVYCHVDTDLLYRWTGSVFTPIKTNPNEGLEMRMVRAYTASSKRYDIPSGVFARLMPSTDVVNINLLQPTSGVPFYRIQIDSGTFFDDNDVLVVEQINWPLALVWPQGKKPTIDDVLENYGVMVTIYEKWASFTKF